MSARILASGTVAVCRAIRGSTAAVLDFAAVQLQAQREHEIRLKVIRVTPVEYTLSLGTTTAHEPAQRWADRINDRVAALLAQEAP